MESQLTLNDRVAQVLGWLVRSGTSEYDGMVMKWTVYERGLDVEMTASMKRRGFPTKKITGSDDKNVQFSTDRNLLPPLLTHLQVVKKTEEFLRALNVYDEDGDTQEAVWQTLVCSMVRICEAFLSATEEIIT